MKEPWERLCAYAEEQPYQGLLLLRRAQAHRALHSDDPDGALAAYDDVIELSSRAGRRSMLWVWGTIPRILLAFDHRDRVAALTAARAYLVEARNVGSRRFVQPALSRIAVMLARVGRDETAAVLQSFTREPAGGAAMSDGDPAAQLTFETLSSDQVARALERGKRLSYDEAIQLALDELGDAIEAIDV